MITKSVCLLFIIDIIGNEESLGRVDNFDIVDLEFAVGADLRIVGLGTLPAHYHVSAVEEDYVAAVGVADYAEFVVADDILRVEVAAAHSFLSHL